MRSVMALTRTRCGSPGIRKRRSATRTTLYRTERRADGRLLLAGDVLTPRRDLLVSWVERDPCRVVVVRDDQVGRPSDTKAAGLPWGAAASTLGREDVRQDPRRAARAAATNAMVGAGNDTALHGRSSTLDAFALGEPIKACSKPAAYVAGQPSAVTFRMVREPGESAVVVDWDGTATEVDGLHMVLLGSGTSRDLRGARGTARTRAHAPRGHRRRVRERSVRRYTTSSSGSASTRGAPGIRRSSRGHESARRLERIPRADRAGAGAGGARARRGREPSRSASGWLARPLPQRRALPGVRRALQARRCRPPRRLHVRRRRVLGPLRRARGDTRPRSRRPR